MKRRRDCIRTDAQSVNRCGGVPAPVPWSWRAAAAALIHRLAIQRFILLRLISKRRVRSITPDASYPESATKATNCPFVKVLSVFIGIYSITGKWNNSVSFLWKVNKSPRLGQRSLTLAPPNSKPSPIRRSSSLNPGNLEIYPLELFIQ